MTIDARPRMAWAGLVLAVGLAACGGDAEADPADGEAPEGSSTRVINVETTVLEPRTFVENIRLTGTVEANRDVSVAAEESGVVRELLVEKGRPVSAGQPLARIDDRILRSQVAEARARAELARETWERRKRLWEENGVGSELAYLEARFQAQQAQASLETLEERLDRTVVQAPIDGILDDRLVEVGTMVSPGMPVARIVDLDPVKVTAGVPERYATDVSRGARAEVTFSVLDDQIFSGRISYVGSAVDPQNRTFPVEFTLPNPDRAIKPEMVAELTVVRREVEDAIVVPQEALVRVEEGYVVFVVRPRGDDFVAESREVALGATQRNQAVVTRGLEAGDQLIVVGQEQVAGGDLVRVVGER